MRFFILFSLIAGSFLYSQSAKSDTITSQYEIIYRLKMVRDTLVKDNVIEEDLSLLIKGSTSLFKSNKKAVKDSVMMAIGEKAFAAPANGKVILDMRNVPSVFFPDEVFAQNGKQTVFKEFLRNRFAFPLEDKVIWQLDKETKKIGSYLCHKASGKYKNRNYEAWYTSEIPINDGPYIFKGLPGLILEIYDTKTYNIFSMISVKKVAKPMVLMKEAINTTYQTFQKSRQNYLNDPAGTVLSRIGGFKLTPEDIERINSNARRDNNFID